MLWPRRGFSAVPGRPYPNVTSLAQPRKSDRWWWIGGFLFGFIPGLALSLTYGWLLDPRPLPVSPADLAPSDKAIYLRLVAVAYAHDRDETKARARLAALDDPHIEQTVLALTEQYIAQNRDIRDIKALIALARALGQTSAAMMPFIATPT
ncbi:MAG: hypothetical protein D6784_06700, partial [Chloroflexi bacterium]